MNSLSTLPTSLCIKYSGQQAEGYGVWSLKDIGIRTRFGPYKGRYVNNSEQQQNKGFQWKVQTKEDKIVVLDGSEDKETSWLRYINYAINKEEQNMVALQHHSEVYFVTCKAIPANSQLFVWYQDKNYQSKCSQKEEASTENSTAKLKRIHSEAFKSLSLDDSKIGYNKSHRITSPRKTSYECGVCHKRYSRKDYLKEHERDHTGEKPYQCEICKRAFKTIKSLKRHIRNHHSDTKYQCDICEKYLMTAKNLSHHKLVHTSGRDFTCEVCNKSFVLKNELHTHMLTHVEEKSCQYNLSHEKSKNSASLKRINKRKGLNDESSLQRKATIEIRMPYECGICHKKYWKKQGLQFHERDHTGERPYQCEVCEKTFKRPSNYKVHMKTHNTTQKYQCDICQKYYKSALILNRHKLLHTGERPFACKECSMCFSFEIDLKLHVLRHTGEMPYQCEVCHKKFSIPSLLKSHQLLHVDGKPYECEVCKARFRSSYVLWCHRRIHTGEKPYECKICHKKFRFYSPFFTHKKIHTDKKTYQCEICQKTFTKRRKSCCKQLLPLKCALCDEQFSRYSEFLKHKSKHQENRS